MVLTRGLLALVVALPLTGACQPEAGPRQQPVSLERDAGGDGGNGGSTAGDGPGDRSPPPARAPSDVRARARRIQSYIINYAGWDGAALTFAKKHDLVIVHPRSNGNLTRAFVADLQAGVDPRDPADDVLVLCYISVGEDTRSAHLDDDAARADPRFTGDGSGPRVDPRGPTPARGTSLAGIDPLGAPSSGGTGWASYYLDDNSVYRSPQQRGDGVPDRNAVFGGFFVNAGDPKWFDLLDASLLDGPDGEAGIRELLTPDHGRGLDCDGLFLDTVDTAVPNQFTSESSLNLSKFEWTAPGMTAFITRLRQAYPDRILLQNRGMFYFDSSLPHFQHSTRGQIDLGFFESYRLDSGEFSDHVYRDNRFNTTPKLLAEAGRPDGFTVLSLGYVEGTGLPTAVDTLLGKGSDGLQSLLEDIHVTQELAGFRHYITDGAVALVNGFVREHSRWGDESPPAWTSTHNDNDHAFPRSPEAPTPRVGIQEAVPGPGPGVVTIRWDVALDKHRVGYALYHQSTPFDFEADPNLARAARVVLAPEVGDGYQQGTGPAVYPYQARIAGLPPGQPSHLVIRAFDESPARNEDRNQVVLSAAPGAPAP